MIFLLKKTFFQDDNQIKNVHNIKVYNNRIYISASEQMFVFDKNFNFIEKLNIPAYRLFLIENDYIYYTLPYAQTKLFKYSLLDKTTILLNDNIMNNTYNDNGRLIFCDSDNNLYFISEDSNVFFTHRNNYLGGFYINNHSGEIILKGKIIVIRYDNIDYILNTENNLNLYEQIYSYNDKIFFSTYDFINNEKCNDNFCICHYGLTNIWCFDTNSKELSSILTLPKNSHLISFDYINNSFCYYNNGALYRDNLKIKSVPIIEPYSEYVQVSKMSLIDDSISSYSFFYDNKNTLFHHYIDRRDFVKNKY